MNQKIFYQIKILAILVLFSCSKHIYRNTDGSDSTVNSLSCCQNLKHDTMKYKTWLNQETSSELSGYFKGEINNKLSEGFAMSYKDSSLIHFSLFTFDKQKKTTNGCMHFFAKIAPDSIIYSKDFQIHYDTYISGACVTTDYQLDSNKSNSSFLKYLVLDKKSRVNGCFSTTLWVADKDFQKKYNLPDSIVFSNIRFSANLK
jgi:hypothetical protein